MNIGLFIDLHHAHSVLHYKHFFLMIIEAYIQVRIRLLFLRKVEPINHILLHEVIFHER